MEKIRVLRVITWLPVGGIERKIVDVLPRLDPARFEVHVALVRERGPLADELEARGVPVHLIPFKRRWDMGAMRRLAALMRELKIDVVHSHMYRSNLPATVAARMARRADGGPRVWCQVHNVNTWESPRQRAMDRWLCRWREGMIAVSEQVRRDVIANLRLPPERVRVIYNGVDLERFGREGREGEIRRAAARELRQVNAAGGSEDVVFLLAARLVEQKRPQDFLTLARRLQLDRAAGLHTQARPVFWILGEGPMRDQLEDQARALPDPDAVRFFGKRDDVERFMAAADIFAMTSTKEGFSNALLEAMASGCVCVATDVGGNAEAIRDGRDGVIIPPMEPEALHRAAARLLDDADLRRAVGRAAALRARDFSVEAMVRNVEALYEETAAKGSAAARLG